MNSFDIMVLYTKVNHWIPSKYDLFWTKGQFLHPTPQVVTKQATMLLPLLIITFWAHYIASHILIIHVYTMLEA
jgi:hypothetical protein